MSAIPAQLSNLASTTSRSSPSPLRHRPPNRAATFGGSYPTLRHRRSSNLSETAQSFKSSTDSLLLPRTKSPEEAVHHIEESHWQSVPLALALFPALGGLVFKNGGAVVTDITLLALAAIFLNWSVRLPWDWYHAAQHVSIAEQHPLKSFQSNTTIIEEGSEDAESQTSQPASPSIDTRQNPVEESSSTEPATRQDAAAKELRVHELLALFTCFLAPMIGAWLLHHIRAQLSRPSEGLVSNYNLTVFLLASELRPMSHLIKLVQARTLHLQRLVAENTHQASQQVSQEAIDDLYQRMTDLETRVVNGATKSPTTTQQQLQELTTATRKVLQSDLDPLNRAVRRYEKRATLFSMQTETRLQDLENKLADALTLAAAAERSSQAVKQRRGSGMIIMVDWASKAVLLPMQMAWAVISLPGRVLTSTLQYLEAIVGITLWTKGPAQAGIESRTGKDTEKNRRGRGPKKTT